MEATLSSSPKPHKLIDFNSAQEIPDSHIWESIEDDGSDAGVAFITPESLPPVIDLNDPNVTELVGNACKTWGVFQITNHGVPANLIDDIVRAGKNLFALPLEQKLKAARAPGGVSGYGESHYASLFPKHMWFEGFTICGSPLEHAQKLWPNDYGQFCDVVSSYERGMKKLADRLMRPILGSLDIVGDDIDWGSQKAELIRRSQNAVLQLNSYPTCPDPSRAMGLIAHTDATIFTILYQNQVSGLQIRPKNSRWVTVPPIPNAFVINVGDFLNGLSNGLYPSAFHRAMVNQTENRLSVVYFYGAPGKVKESPLSKSEDPTHPPLEWAISWKETRATDSK